MTEMRPVKLWNADIRQEEREDGSILVWQAEPLGPYPRCISDRIAHWAEAATDRTWMAERAGDDWRRVSFAELAEHIARAGSRLLELGLSVEHPLLILSGNGVDHAIAALSAQHVGIPSAAIAPAYSLSGGGFPKLRDIVAQITPGAIFVDDATPFAPAIAEVIAPDIPVIAVRGVLDNRAAMPWSDVVASAPTEAGRRAAEAVTPDTIAKFLFTSGTTGSPKAVIQTQRMLCSNMEMVVDCYAYMRDEPPVFVDWAPWNHVASGNKVFNMPIYTGGTYYIDHGKPTPQGIRETIRNLKEIAPTWYFNVPVGFEALIAEMEADQHFAETFFSRLRLLMYAGAGLAGHAWDKLNALSVKTTGAQTLLTTGLGATETAPFALMCTEPQDGPGNIGIPAKDVVIKLVPFGDKLEIRLKGPLVTPGYWRNPKLTAEAFDEEGYYKLGDAVRFAVPGDASKGFYFDGRVAENFKLNTGTWVAVGALRAQLVDALGGLARDVVIAGENRDELGALIVPSRAAAEALVPDGTDLSDAEHWAHSGVRAALADRLSAFAGKATGSSNRIMRALVLTDPLDLNAGEVTDKGSVNQRAVLNNRPEAIAALYSDGPDVIRAERPPAKGA